MLAARMVSRGRALSAVALASYLWFCWSWFDHGLRSRSNLEAVLAALFFLAAAGALAFRYRKRITIGTDGRIALALALLGSLSRAPYVFPAYGLFSSDAAAQGVMALHILEGRHHPVFLYNWSYIGSLKAHLTALLTWLIGEPVVAFALAADLVYGALAGSIYLLGRTVLTRAESVVAALYIVFAPGFFTAWGMGNEGSYPDVLVLGTLMLFLGARFLKGEAEGVPAAFWMGLAGGLAFWVHVLATYYLIAALVILLLHRFGRESFVRLAAFLLGFALGDFPALLWNVTNDWLSFRWWSLGASGLEENASRLSRAVGQLGGVFSKSFAVLSGFWPPESPPPPEAFFRIALLAVIPVSFGAFLWRERAQVQGLLRGRLTPEAALLGFALLVIGVFAQSSFGWMTDEPRYLLFLYSVVPIFLASAISSLARRSRLSALLVVTTLVFVSVRGGVYYFAVARESDARNREFLARLDELGVRYVHSDYHLSYKYVFLSHGRMVWTSELGPASTEWYLPFREEADAASDVALVPRSYRFARRIEKRLGALGLTYRREDLLYPVLYDFSEPVRLEALR
jgi:hypothetical protein